MFEAREDVLAFCHFQEPLWEKGLEHQPARARQRGNQTPHPHGGDPTQRRGNYTPGGRGVGEAERTLAARGPAHVLGRKHGCQPLAGGPTDAALAAESHRLMPRPTPGHLRFQETYQYT